MKKSQLSDLGSDPHESKLMSSGRSLSIGRRIILTQLPQESRPKLFKEMDLNEDGVIQYDEFKIQAQIAESEVLDLNKEDAYIEAYKVAMEDLIITDDEGKMLNVQAKMLGISDERASELERNFNLQLELCESE